MVAPIEKAPDGLYEDILRMEKITKVYPNGLIANKGIDFSVRKGEIHALAGENGAGKSTLMKVLFGEETSEEGCIIYKGKTVKIDSPLTAIGMGIGMVHQHFMLVPSLTVAENMVLGLEPKRWGMVDFAEAVKRTEDISRKYALPIDPRARITNLQVGMKQRVEILKALLRGADLLILDEPTAVLTPQETVEIFRELKLLKEMGHTVIFISHKLDEIKELCDRVTVIRDGRLVSVCNVVETTKQEISRLMVGRDVMLSTKKAEAQPTEVCLDVNGLRYENIAGQTVLDDVSIKVRNGEILGIAGIEGNGQNELSELITGIRKLQAGSIHVSGNNISKLSVRAIRETGVSHISQDRLVYGVVGSAGVWENIIADRYYKKEFRKGMLLDRHKINTLSDELIEGFGIRCDDRNSPVASLSGGNMQKVVVAREFSSEPLLVIANQPTRGIDVGAAELVRNKLIELRDNGSGILLISADLTEVIELSDRLIVLLNGKIVAAFESLNAVSSEDIGEYMLGLKVMVEDEIRRVAHE